MDALRDGEAGGIDAKDGDVGELVAVGIEELVVVNVAVLAEDPSCGQDADKFAAACP